MTLGVDRIRALHAAKLRVLARNTLDLELTEVSGTDEGAFGLAVPPRQASDAGGADSTDSNCTDADSTDDSVVAVCLAQERTERALGGALAFAEQALSSDVHIFASTHGDVLARRAACFAPAPAVWTVTDASAKATVPAPRPVESAPPRVPELIALLASAGVEIAVEHGVITGEVEGLEVARIVPASAAVAAASSTAAVAAASSTAAVAAASSTAASDDKVCDSSAESGSAESGLAWQIQVGVGAHDREAFSLLHPDEPTAEAVRRIAETVSVHRSPGAQPHPLNRMGAARLLRSLLIRRPDLCQAGRLRAASPPLARAGPKDSSPAVAYGLTPEGRRLVVVTCVGIDLDVVPFAADARLLLDPDAELTIALPRRDVHKAIRAMAAKLRHPAQIVEIDDGWRAVE